jgi:hypothetical protein
MWNIETLRPATGEASRVAASLREVACRNELADSRLPDFVTLSGMFGKLCLPFYEHRVQSFAPHIFEALRKHGEREIIIFENPLFEESSQYIAAANLDNDRELRTLIDEKFFDGGYIVGTVAPLFRWFGNFTDYGFMFTDAAVIEDILQASPFTTYSVASKEFRVSHGGDLLLNAEICKLDKLWSVARELRDHNT